MSILVLNSGSSSLKFSLFDDEVRAALAKGVVHLSRDDQAAMLSITIGDTDGKHTITCRDVKSHADAIGTIINEITKSWPESSIRAVGHRVVHGGSEFRQATRIDDAVLESLKQISPLAPLHNPPAVTAIERSLQRLPDATHVAVFDTAFFANLPRRATVYPVPKEWEQKYGIKRYGFHGISHEYCAKRAAGMLDRKHDARLKLVVLHLGSGCSVSAIQGMRPISTSMGFTPLEGLMMGTRCGSIDPGIILHLLQYAGVEATDLSDTLIRKSGLLGVSGVSSDYREIEKAASRGDEHSQLALDIFVDRVRAGIGSMAVLLGGVDGLVFTGGIGENSITLREAACRDLEWMGVSICEVKNQSSQGDCDISSRDSETKVLVIGMQEEIEIAEVTLRIIRNSSSLS